MTESLSAGSLSLLTERVDDIPLLLAQMQKLEMAQRIDTHFSAHGNRKGLSYGALACVWLTHILSQADHRMNQVRQWATQRSNTLQTLMPTAFGHSSTCVQNSTFVETDFSGGVCTGFSGRTYQPGPAGVANGLPNHRK